MKKNDPIHVFSISLKNFYSFVVFLNFISISIFFLIERYHVNAYLILIIIFDLVLFGKVLDKKNIRKISIDEKTKRVEITTSIITMLSEKIELQHNEIEISYERERYGRTAKGMVLRIKDLDGKLIGKMTSQLSFWKEQTIEEVNNILTRLKCV
ncbi:MAG: hypothetical protein H6571_01530 [Lewinellaceae bacterium]|nr:hypothetical protein [Lewinellaceae bacterium]